MRRTYPFLRSWRAPGALALVASLVLAGCGSSSPASTAPAAASGSSTSGEFDAQLVPTTTKTSSTPAKPSSGGKVSLAKATQALEASSGTATTTTTTHVATTPVTVPVKVIPPTVPPVKRTTTFKPPTHKTTTVTTPAKTITKVVTVTKYQTKYDTKTVAVTPPVPMGAFLPSKHSALSLTSFTALGGSVGCVIGGGSVRCDVATPSWTAPTQPASCTQSWGNGIVLTNSSASKPAQFACGGTSALSSGSSNTISAGYDDTVGAITCQVRSFGVNCFATDNQGFILSQTGYILY
jgi:hypothetical protein